MKNSEAIKRRLEKAKKIEDTHLAISTLADIQYDMGMGACEERTALRKEIDGLRKAISGNGDPESSILSRLHSVENFMGDVSSDVKDIKDALLGTLDDGEMTGGFISRLRECEKLNKELRKLFWIVVGVLVAQLGASLFGLF